MKKSNYYRQEKTNWFKSSTLKGTKTNWDKPISPNEIAELGEIYSDISDPSEEEFIKNKLMREKRREEKSMRETLIREKLIQDTVDNIKQRNSTKEDTTPTLFDNL